MTSRFFYGFFFRCLCDKILPWFMNVCNCTGEVRSRSAECVEGDVALEFGRWRHGRIVSVISADPCGRITSNCVIQMRKRKHYSSIKKTHTLTVRSITKYQQKLHYCEPDTPFPIRTFQLHLIRMSYQPMYFLPSYLYQYEIILQKTSCSMNGPWLYTIIHGGPWLNTIMYSGLYYILLCIVGHGSILNWIKLIGANSKMFYKKFVNWYVHELFML